MKLLQLKYILAGLIAALLLNGCKDDNDIFSGADNFITAFSLEKDGTTYLAFFYSNSIIITAPDGVSLKGATVSYTLSENADITPDPKTITDWDSQALFAVTSYSGQRQTFKYVVERNSINTKGTVILTTQEEVDAFGAEGKTAVEGSLVIGRTVGTDSITSLSALYQIKSIGYNLIINPTFTAKELTGLDGLETVGGEININAVTNLKSIEFQGLKTAGSIYIKNDSINSAEFPKLTRVENNLYFDFPLNNSPDLRNLRYVGGELSIQHSYNSGNIKEISLPMLEEAGSIYVARYQKLSKLEFPVLKTVGILNLYYLTSVNVIYLPKLVEVTGTISLPQSSKLTEMSLPLLRQAGGITVPMALTTFEIPLLAEVTGDFYMSSLTSENLGFMASLTSVGGKLTIYNFPNIERFELPSSLKNVGTLSIYYSGILPPKVIDVKGHEIDILEIRGAALVNTKIIGDEEFDGILSINSDGTIPSGYTASFPELEGFSTVDSLIFGYVQISNFNMKGIKKINRGFYLPYNGITEFYLPDLEEVGGDFKIEHLNGSTQETVEIPKLKTVAGSFSVMVNSENTKTLSFPLLESVGGDFTLQTGYNSGSGLWATLRSLTSARFPSLTAINGKLTVTSYTGSTDQNALMINLDGFSALTSIKGAEILNQGALVSYKGLKNALGSFSANEWSAANNAYNPTYEELSSGQWVQP